jgi:hypothetical protein
MKRRPRRESDLPPTRSCGVVDGKSFPGCDAGAFPSPSPTGNLRRWTDLRAHGVSWLGFRRGASWAAAVATSAGAEGRPGWAEGRRRTPAEMAEMEAPRPARQGTVERRQPPAVELGIPRRVELELEAEVRSVPAACSGRAARVRAVRVRAARVRAAIPPRERGEERPGGQAAVAARLAVEPEGACKDRREAPAEGRRAAAARSAARSAAGG